jgi:hypothetical protein
VREQRPRPARGCSAAARVSDATPISAPLRRSDHHRYSAPVVSTTPYKSHHIIARAFPPLPSPLSFAPTNMSFETGVAWYDALPGLDLTQCDTPSDHWRRLFWSAQIAKTRGAARPDDVASLHALACTLLTAYRCGLGPECLSECLCLLRDLHGRGLGLARWTLDFEEALFAEHERTGAIEPIEEMVRIHEEAPTTGTLSLDVRCQLAKALIARGSFTGEDADLSRAKCILDAIGPLIEAGSSPHFAVVLAMCHVAFSRAYKEFALEDVRSLADTLRGHLQCTDSQTQRCRMDLQAAYFAISAIICYQTHSASEQGVQIADAALLNLHHNSFVVTIALSEFCIVCEAVGVGETRHVPRSRQLVQRLFRTAQGNCIEMSEAHHSLGRWMDVSRGWASNDYTNSLEIAVTHHRQALALCPPNHIHRYRCLVGLSFGLIRLYRSSGRRDVLKEGTALLDRYADVTRRVPAFAINASHLMCLRAESGRLRMDSKQSLAQRAVQVLQDAVLVTPPSSSVYGFLLRTLTNVYRLQSRWGCSVNGTEHLANARRGMAAAVGEHDTRGQGLMELCLAEVLINNARQTHDTASLDEGISLLERMSKQPLPSRSDSALRVDAEVASWQAKSYMIRYKLLGINEDLDTAKAFFRLSCSNAPGGLFNTIRLALVLDWADAAHYAEQSTTEMDAYKEIVMVLPQLAYLGEEVQTRVEALQLAEGLACRAAATSLTCGDMYGAIELLEQSRGVVWTQTLRLKIPLSSVPPDYADDFARIAGELKQTSNDTSDAATKRRDSASGLDGLLERIRQVEGYERFLLPRAYLELRSCTSHGFVVLVIPSDTCTDVLIMRSEEVTPTHLRLSSVQVQRLQDWTAELKRSCDQSRAAVSRDSERIGYKVTEPLPPPRAQAHLKVLRELWTEVVQPVLASLGVKVRSGPDFSRCGY